MEKDKISCACFVWIVTVFALVGVVFGFIAGCFVFSSTMWNSLDKAGISRLITHKTIVDGVVTTNWVEIVWKNEVK